jgi:hypothetical protein
LTDALDLTVAGEGLLEDRLVRRPSDVSEPNGRRRGVARSLVVVVALGLTLSLASGLAGGGVRGGELNGAAVNDGLGTDDLAGEFGAVELDEGETVWKKR